MAKPILAFFFTLFSFLYYEKALGHTLTLSSIKNSILLAALSTMLDIIIGVTIAYLLARRRFRGMNLSMPP